MNILCVGTDIINIKRIEKILKGKNNKFKKKIPWLILCKEICG